MHINRPIPPARTSSDGGRQISVGARAFNVWVYVNDSLLQAGSAEQPASGAIAARLCRRLPTCQLLAAALGGLAAAAAALAALLAAAFALLPLLSTLAVWIGTGLIGQLLPAPCSSVLRSPTRQPAHPPTAHHSACMSP